MDNNKDQDLFLEKMQAPIIVTGCARSGTSMIAGAIELCGAFGGQVASKSTETRELHEHTFICESIVKPYLLRSGIDPSCQYPLPNIHWLNIPKDWKRRVQKAIIHDGYENGQWFYKSTKACLMWPVWNYAFPNAKWIIVRRRTGDIIDSCLKTDFMKAFKQNNAQQAVRATNEFDGWRWWVHQHEKRFVEMIMGGVNCKVVWPHRMVYGDYQEMMETIDWLGLKWNSNVLSFIDPKLWKSRMRGGV
jgi:hypothetical protein